MKKVLLAFVIAFAFSTTGMAAEIAISTQGGWMGQGHADTEAQEIVDNVTGASIEVFTPSDLDALADWVREHTGDGVPDLLVMFGIFPATIYPAGNAQPDGSLAEQFLDDGNVIVNTGDYIFYVGSAGNNDAGGLANMMDVPAAAMWGDDSGSTTFTPTADGQLYTPSLTTLPTNRPWFPAQFADTDWEFELILAQSDDGTQVHPGILHNTVTGGRLGVFFQYSDDTQPRGEVISEWINNWYLINVATGNPLARKPDPKDGALFEQTWGSLVWSPGDWAVSHDVYIGTNFDDVNNGTADTFVGNTAQPTQILGFVGFPYPDGLVPGATYYWRVDEVNDANAASPWKGKVWSFSITPTTAYSPIPADGGKFVVTEDLALSWAPGFEAKLHVPYFGTSFDEVDAAAGGLPQALTTFTPPGPLEPQTTYYWRVDELNPPATTKGPVWSFTTARLGGGVTGNYFSGMNFENFMLTRIDPEIDFNWGDPGGPDPLVGDDNFSCRWTGEVEAGFTETYTFYGAADDGVRLWVDGVQLVNAWIDQGTTEYSGEIDLVAGNTYSIVMEQYENGGGATAYLRWSSPSTPKQIIPQAALSQLVHAHSPKPTSGTQGLNLMSELTWGAGESAGSHEVYLGTDADAVANATKASPEYKGSKALGDESLDPGLLDFDTTYFWRIDEVNATNPDSPWKGNVWSLWTGDFLVVDDFEAYDDIDPLPGETGNRIFDKWIDGYGTATNGALVGNDMPPYAEQTIVNSGAQSMNYRYDLTGKIAEATLTLVFPTDWTAHGVTKLSLQFHGSSANSADRMFVALGNSVVYHPDAAATQMTGWNDWVINLTDFAGVNPANVGSITIGIGTRNVPGVDSIGTMYFDDIRLIP